MANRYSDDPTVEEAYQETQAAWYAYWDLEVDPKSALARRTRSDIWRRRLAILARGPQTRQVRHHTQVCQAALRSEDL